MHATSRLQIAGPAVVILMSVLVSGLQGEERSTVKPGSQRTPKPAKESSLSDHFAKWVMEDVIYIITAEELRVFRALTTDEERENFIAQFWERRNPDPREGTNEFKMAHYARIAYANEHFASGVPGWKTDRGRMYIVYGEPDSVERHPSGGAYNREFWEGGGQTTVYPFERWRYRHIDGFGDDVEFEFVDASHTNEYKLAMSAEEKDMLLHVPGAGLTESEISGETDKKDRVAGYLDQTRFQRSKDAPFERLSRFFNAQRPPQIQFTDLKGIVTTRISYNQLPYVTRTDFIRISPGRVMVPITVELDNRSLEFRKQMGFNRASVHVYGLVTSLQNRIVSEFENTIAAEYSDEFFEAGKNKRSIYQAIVFVAPGNRYRLDLVLKDTNSGRAGSMSTAIAVPSFTGDDLQASSVILANYIQAVPPTYDRLEQFVIGDMKVQPNVTCMYRPSGDVLFPYLQVYNISLDQSTLEPSVEITYRIKSAGKVVDSQDDAKGRTVQFVSGGRVVIVGQVPVRDLEPGNYRLEISVLDRIANRSLITGADFQVVSAAEWR